jgi:His-Xaa-Ser system protein HxsD
MEGFPVELHEGSARLELDEAVYPLEAVYGAAYIFIDRCYVLIDKPAAGKWRVTLAPKKDGDLGAMAGEFANELLSCAWRHQITQQNRAVIETVTTQAIAGAMGPPSLDDLEKFDFSAETFEDPLGIAKSWEEKYKKK